MKEDRFFVGLKNAGVITFIIALVFFCEQLFGWKLSYYGIIPRQAGGILGILTAPFLHGGWEHLISNLFSLFTLLVLINYFYERVSISVITSIWIGTGILVWIFGKQNTYHIGASGVIYGIISFLFFSGFFRGSVQSIMISLTVLFLHSSFFEGFMPKEGISWQSHLYGALIGMVMSFIVKSVQEPWEKEEVANKEVRNSYFRQDAFDLTKAERYALYVAEQERIARENEQIYLDGIEKSTKNPNN